MATRLVSLSEAASALGLPVSGVEALIAAGYLAARDDGLVPNAQVEAFRARNADRASDAVADLFADLHGVDVGAEEILTALEASIPEMATRAADIIGGAFPEAAAWSDRQRGRFEEQARSRFSAILAFTRADDAGEDILSDLEDVGGDAAFAGAPLPQVLLTLRVSRDLLVQSAVSAAEELGQEWGLALAVVLTRILPALDRLTDRIATGYWNAVRVREQEAFARYEHVVEHAASGVYEVDLDGTVRYANATMAGICGVDVEDLVDRDLALALPPADHFQDVDVYRTPTEAEWRSLRVLRSDGVVRELQLQITARTHEGAVVGFDGIVRDMTAPHALERQKNDFLTLITQELRQPISTVLGLGATLVAHADELPRERMERMGHSIHAQAERLMRLADDVADVARIRASELEVTTRPVQLAGVVDAALRMLPKVATDALAVDVDAGLVVTADARRLEQVLAHLVENGFLHGRAPVTVTAQASGTVVRIEIRDHGAGVGPTVVRDLFARLRPTDPDDLPRRDRVAGLGLPLARTLVEAMGGRIGYEPADPGARFVVTLPSARR